jgi:exopolysaccharide biosynthesis WecB/TagA/CpsF family protein
MLVAPADLICSWRCAKGQPSVVTGTFSTEEVLASSRPWFCASSNAFQAWSLPGTDRHRSVHSRSMKTLPTFRRSTKLASISCGLGSERQNKISVAQHVGKIHAAALLGVGAAFDFVSGVKPRAPLWMQRSSLEWLFRLPANH